MNRIIFPILVALGIILIAYTFALAGPMNGKMNEFGTVPDNSIKFYKVRLFASESTTITLDSFCGDSEGETNEPMGDIDLLVWDENNKLVGKSESLGCHETVVVTPICTCFYIIGVENVNKPNATKFELILE